MPNPFVRGAMLTVRLCGVCLALLLWSGVSLAAPPSLDRERARTLMDQGDARFEAAAYEAALESYRAADAIMGVPTTAIEVARTLDKLGRLLQAREVLQRIASSAPQPDEPKAFAAARQRAERQATETSARIPRLRIAVAGLASGVVPELGIDGQRLDAGKLGVAVEVDPGPHHVTGRAPGYAEATGDLAVVEGQLHDVTLAFTAEAAPAGPTLSGPDTGRAPTDEAASTGAHRRPVLLWTGVGVSIVGVAVGTLTGLESLSLTKDAKARCEDNACPESAEGDISSAKTMANVSNVAFGVAIAGLAVSVWQLLTPPERKPATARLEPHVEVTVGLGHVGLQGAF